MGLDMYLEKRTYVKNWDFQKPEERHEITVKKGGEIVEEVGYWRKANAVHAWFVENVQDGRDECQTSYVDGGSLRKLLELVNQVLADHSLAPELLPTKSGFFFGGTNYDEWYFKDLEDTKVILEAALADDSGDYYYHASW